MRILMTLLFAAVLAACGPSRKDLSAPLAFVPADTPYVFANLEPLPDDFIESYETAFKPVRDLMEKFLDEARELAEEPLSDGEPPKVLAVLDLVRDKFSVEGWERIGFTRRARAAIYGVGSVPVVRVELADPDRLRGFIGELEAALGEELPTAQVDGHTYWRMELGEDDVLGDPDRRMAMVMSIQDRHLVLTLHFGGDDLATLLGLKRPRENLLDAGTLKQINREFGYTPYGTMLVDVRRLVASLFGQDGRETFVTRELSRKGQSQLTTCRDEFMGIATRMPRLVAGYTYMGGNGVESHGLIELDAALAQSFQAMVAAVPGLGRHQASPAAEFGFGLKLDKLAEFLQAQASAISAQPYACEVLSGLNGGARETSQQLAGLYMAAAWFNGMRIVLEDMQWSEGKPSTASLQGGVVIASPNPLSLVGMLKGVVPQLASLELAPGGPPQVLQVEDLGPDVPPSWVAMGDTALAIGVGEGGDARATGYLSAAAPARPPLLYLAYRGAFYAQMTKAFSDAVGAILDGTEGDGLDDEAMDEAGKGRKRWLQRQQEGRREVDAALARLYEAIDFSAFSLVPGERGLEIVQVVRLAR